MDIIFYPVAQSFVLLHHILAPLFGNSSGVTWGLMIVILTLVTRALVLPLNLKQWHAQRQIVKFQPETKALNDTFRNNLTAISDDPDLTSAEKKKLNSEAREEHIKVLQKMHEENGLKWSNLFLPIFVQGFVGFMLFNVLRTFQPSMTANYGISEQIHSYGVAARIFGAPLSSTGRMNEEAISALGAVPGTVQLVAYTFSALILIISIFSYWISARRTAAEQKVDGIVPTAKEAAMQKKVGKLPYILFIFAGLFYPSLPIGLLVAILVMTVWATIYQRVLMVRTFKMEKAAKDKK